MDNIFSEDDGNSWLSLTLKGCRGNRCRDVVRYHNNSQDWAAIVMRSQKKSFYYKIQSRPKHSNIHRENCNDYSFCIVLVRMWKIAIRIVFHIFVASKQQLLEDTGHMSKYKPVWLILARLALKALAYRRAWMFTYWFIFSNTNPLQTYKLERWTSYFHSVQKRQNKEKNIKERDELLK